MCKAGDTSSVAPRNKTRPWNGYSRARVQHWKICWSPKSRPLPPGTLRSHTPGCQAHCPGSSELGGTSEVAFPSPISQTMAVRPAEAVTRQSSVAAERGAAPKPRSPPGSRQRAPPTPGICFSPSPTPQQPTQSSVRASAPPCKSLNLPGLRLPPLHSCAHPTGDGKVPHEQRARQ